MSLLLPRFGVVSRSATASCVHVASAHAAEELLEEVGEASSSAAHVEMEVAKRIALSTASTSSEAAELVSLLPVFAILVILAPLLRVAQDLVGLVEQLKLSGRLWVVRMKVGMKLLGALAVSLLYLVLWSILRDAHHLVVINECHILSFLSLPPTMLRQHD